MGASPVPFAAPVLVPSPTGGALVTAVEFFGGSVVKWVFDTPISSAPAGAWISVFQIEDKTVNSLIDQGEDYLYITYDSAPEVGTPWQVLTSPAELVFEGGLGLLAPQSGLTT